MQGKNHTRSWYKNESHVFYVGVLLLSFNRITNYLDDVQKVLSSSEYSKMMKKFHCLRGMSNEESTRLIMIVKIVQLNCKCISQNNLTFKKDVYIYSTLLAWRVFYLKSSLHVTSVAALSTSPIPERCVFFFGSFEPDQNSNLEQAYFS